MLCYSVEMADKKWPPKTPEPGPLHMTATRLPDTPIGRYPVPRSELRPGSFWKLTRPLDEPGGGLPLNIWRRPTDRKWFGGASAHPTTALFKNNHSGWVWGVVDPLGWYGILADHDIIDHADSTITCRTQIAIVRTVDQPRWVGTVSRGQWVGTVLPAPERVAEPVLWNMRDYLGD